MLNRLSTAANKNFESKERAAEMKEAGVEGLRCDGSSLTSGFDARPQFLPS